MKRFLVLSIISYWAYFPSLCSAQNLVANGGFENYSSPPNYYAQWDRCVGWSNLNGVTGLNPGYGSPDYYNLQGSNGAQMPMTFWTTVMPHSGDGVMGCNSYYGAEEYREYISTPLTTPMLIGKEYHISFWMTNGSAGWRNGASSNRVGMKLTTAPLSQSMGEVVGGGVPPQIEIAGVVWDTIWKKHTFTIIADSAYQFLTFGNFYADAATTVVQQVSNAWDDSYYYLDDIEVVLGDTSGITIISDQTICVGDSVTLYVESTQGGLNYDWRSLANLTVSLSTDSVFVASPTTTTNYVVQVGNLPAYVTVNVIAPPILNLGKDTTLCMGTQLLLDATNSNSNYLWQDNSTNATNLVTNEGLYHVQLDHYCGQFEDTIQVDYMDIPIVDLGEDTTVCEGALILLNATDDPASYLWQDNSTNPVYEVKKSGTYSVVLSNDCGTASDEIIVEEEDCIISIPTAFSPNKDGVNELFYPINLKQKNLISFKIYNRWGQEVFDAQQQGTIGWDGRFRGVEQPQEVYIYVLKYKSSKDASIVILKGNVTLLR